MEEKTNTPLLKPALIYGLISAFIGILLSVVFHLLDLSMKNWVGWVSIAVSILVVIYLLRAYRNEYLGGYATYGQLILMALLIGLVSSAITALYTYLLYTVIDPDLLERMRIMAEERIMNNPRISESTYDTIIERLDKRMTVSRMTVNSLIAGTVATFIIGLIVSAFLKKESTPEGMGS
ncbi:MAG: DUF4199 domain-containing protein [Bacteroidales bacterium]|nr:DUF4199 domain-containing protein [Bacteroidales bacterium]MBN2697738.1 DUF4199 domain-containing protein [Bacteroidales bacterium]